ncbi:MAG: hypothetical protein EXR91_10730 [Gemmatimonadetes bacterium]|nr:hypothetical protein [Gemmatimonadota bacterium]
MLRHRPGFYGLVADGWDFTDFGSPWPKGPLPRDMDPSEAIVGLLDAERAQGVRLSVSDLLALRGRGPMVAAAIPTTLTETDLDAVRARRAEVFALWEALPAGETLELPFDRNA